MIEINTGDLREGGIGFSQQPSRRGSSAAENKYAELEGSGRVLPSPIHNPEIAARHGIKVDLASLKT